MFLTCSLHCLCLFHFKLLKATSTLSVALVSSDCPPYIRQHGSAVYVGMVVVVCIPYIIQRKTAASVVQGFKSGELNRRGASMDYTPDSANRFST